MQLGELDNHAGYEVAFAQQSSAFQLFFVNLGVDCHSQHISSLNQTVALVVHVAQAFLEGNSFQLLQTVSQGLLSVFIKEELSIAQTSTQHALITMSNDIQMLLAAITHGDEFVQQRAVLSQNREVTLVLTHRRNNAFLRQSQELILEIAAQSSRPFNKIVNLFQQVLIDFCMAAFSNAHISNLLTNQLTASVLVNHNKVII